MHNQELSFALGYYSIKADGMVVFSEKTPEEIKKRFWDVWPSFRKKVIDMQNEGKFSSMYPVLPDVDNEENRKHYEDKI